MSWQEELRKLDEELASGQLSADDYRVRRDQVLSSAVGQPDAPPAPESPGPDATQVIPPINSAPATPQQPAEADRTQAVPPTDPSRTQAISPWQAQSPGQYAAPQYPASPPGGFPQSGPISPAGGFPQAGPASPPGGFPQAGAFPGWNTTDADQVPPWGGGELSSLNSQGGEPGWAQQGPESFDTKPRKGNGKKIAAIVGVVVVLVGVALGAYLLWGRNTPDGSDSHAGPPPISSQAPQPPGPMAIADFPGQAEDQHNVTTFNDIPGLRLLTPEELSTYSDAGAGPVNLVVKDLPDGNRAIVLVVQVTTPSAAQNAANGLLDIQITNGAREFGNVPDGVQASVFDPGDGGTAQVRGHYAHDDKIVRIEVAGKNLQADETDFSSILRAQLQVLPANG